MEHENNIAIGLGGREAAAGSTEWVALGPAMGRTAREIAESCRSVYAHDDIWGWYHVRCVFDGSFSVAIIGALDDSGETYQVHDYAQVIQYGGEGNVRRVDKAPVVPERIPASSIWFADCAESAQ